MSTEKIIKFINYFNNNQLEYNALKDLFKNGKTTINFKKYEILLKSEEELKNKDWLRTTLIMMYLIMLQKENINTDYVMLCDEDFNIIENLYDFLIVKRIEEEK